jgi:hypothetical protein
MPGPVKYVWRTPLFDAVKVANDPNLFEGEHASQQSSATCASAIAAPLAPTRPFVVNEDGLG